MNVMRDEYAPRSTGQRSVSAATTRTSSGSRPSSSATIVRAIELEPWPMSLPPVNTVTRPERSSFSCTPACGIGFGYTG